MKPESTMLAKEFKKDINKLDGWVNLLAGFGKQNTDKTKSTYFEPPTILCDQELTGIWIGDGLGARIVSCVADDMTRKWITVDEDPEEKILHELDRLDAEEKFNEALKWSRLYQGAVIVIGTKGGRGLEEPLPANVQGIEYLKVYPSSRINIDQSDFVTDQNSKYFGDIEVFRIQNIIGTPINVHRSRCLVFKGIPIPADTSTSIDLKMRFWGMSVLNPIWDRLKNFGATEQGIANLMYEIVIGKYRLSNLAELLSENKTDAVYTRMEIINACKSIINAVLLGEGEEYTRDTVNTAGIPEIIDRCMMIIAGIVGIPVTKLFGRSPAGQNSTGTSDLTNYYDMVVAEQKTKLKPGLNKLINLMKGYLKVPKTATMSFNSIWEMTDKEKAEVEKLKADKYNIYLQYGVLTPDEVADMEFPELVEQRGLIEEMPDETGRE